MKTFGFAIAIIVGIGGLVAGGVGVCGYFQVGSLSSLSQMHSIIMMSVGGGGGILLLIVGIVGSVKNYSKSNNNTDDGKPTGGNLTQTSQKETSAHEVEGTQNEQLEKERTKFIQEQTAIKTKLAQQLTALKNRYDEKCQSYGLEIGKANELLQRQKQQLSQAENRTPDEKIQDKNNIALIEACITENNKKIVDYQFLLNEELAKTTKELEHGAGLSLEN